MKFVKVSAGLVAALIIFGSAPSFATTYTYTYTGMPDTDASRSGNYVTAVVDLNCTGPCAAGTYKEGTDFSSFTLTAFNSANTALLSFGTSSPGYVLGGGFGFTNYLTLSGPGIVDNWFLLATNSSTVTLFTLNNDDVTQSGCGCGTQDLAGVGNLGDLPNLLAFVSFEEHPGTWSVSTSETPLPAALPLFASGGALLGFFGWRRKRKAIATA
jgi:hypothetical protein